MEKCAGDFSQEVLNLLIENKCLDCTLFDMHNRNRFADYVVLGTYTSRSHLNGVSRCLEEWMHQNGITTMSRPMNADKWFYWDCGSFVISLMDKESRSFYNLEDLYGKTEIGN